MSRDFGEMPRSASSERIREAMENLQRMPKEKRIDLMVKAKLLTQEQGERAKKKWAEIQAGISTLD